MPNTSHTPITYITNLNERDGATLTQNPGPTVLLIPQTNSDGRITYITSTISPPALPSTSTIALQSTSTLGSSILTTSTSTTSIKATTSSSIASVTGVCYASSSISHAAPMISDTASSTAMEIQYGASITNFSSTWTYQGCYKEGTTMRALSNITYDDDSMTLESCAAFCQGKSLMGVEYERECYCADVLSKESVRCPDQSDCSMLCKGNATEVCGGADVLGLYYFAGMTASGTPVVAGPQQNPALTTVSTPTVDPCATKTPSLLPTSLPITIIKHDNGLSTFAKAGLGVGTALASILIAIAGFFRYRRKNSPHLTHVWKRNSSSASDSSHPHFTVAPIYNKPMSFPRRKKALQGDSDHSRQVFVDTKGVKWPEEVVLAGEAKVLREWTKTLAEDTRMRMGLRNGGVEEIEVPVGGGKPAAKKVKDEELTAYKIRMGLETAVVEDSESSEYFKGIMPGNRDGIGEMGTHGVEDGSQETISEAKLARRDRQRRVSRERRQLRGWL